MPKQFLPGHRYKFSRDVYLSFPGHAMRYMATPRLKALVDRLDGKEVIDGCIGEGEMKVTIDPAWVEELPQESYMRRLFRESVKKVQREDELDKLIERYEETKEMIAEYERLIEELKDEQGCILEEYRQLKAQESDDRDWRIMKI